MPAHSTSAAIGRAIDSQGNPISNIDWRANRLVDAVAKKAAGEARVPASVVRLLSTAARAVEFYAAQLGEITHAANNLKVDVVLPDGNTTTAVKRDSAGLRPATRGAGPKRGRTAVDGDHAGSTPNSANHLGCATVPVHVVNNSTTAKRRRREDHEAVNEARIREYWRANRPDMRPSASGAAHLRMVQLRERVALRETSNYRDTGDM